MNPNRVFMRVKVVRFVDIRGESPRVQIHLDNVYDNAAFDELFRDSKVIQNKTVAEAEQAQIPIPPSLPDELHKYMQIVNDQTRDVSGHSCESGPESPRDTDVRQIRDPLADEGRFARDKTSEKWCSKVGDDRVRRFDPKQIKVYYGRNVYTTYPERYEEQLTTWLRQMHTELTNQGINPQSWVIEALKCVSASVSDRYKERSCNRDQLQEIGSSPIWPILHRRHPWISASLRIGSDLPF